MRKLNWRPRMHHHAVKKLQAVAALPVAVDLRPNDTPIFDQGQEGSCTANAGCGLFDFLSKQQGKLFITSRNFLYWVERAFDGDTGQDAGSSNSTCAKVLTEKGVCLEVTYPYGSTDLYPEPPPRAWGEAFHYKIKQAVSIPQDLQSMKTCLASGKPFTIGISVYDSFETASGGVIPMPGLDENLLGGHALCVVGYNDENQYFIFRNSWGTQWGDQGYGYLPYAYLTSPELASDFWTFEI